MVVQPRIILWLPKEQDRDRPGSRDHWLHDVEDVDPGDIEGDDDGVGAESGDEADEVPVIRRAVNFVSGTTQQRLESSTTCGSGHDDDPTQTSM
jgi:hypothetical protein